MNKYFVLRTMESVDHIVAIRVNETFWAHVWRLRSHYLGMGYDKHQRSPPLGLCLLGIPCSGEPSPLFSHQSTPPP
jgi:hypothetical protein